MNSNTNTKYIFGILVILIFLLLIFYLFSLTNNDSNINQIRTSSSVSTISSFSTSTLEQVPERITNFYSSLPFVSQYFSVERNLKTNSIVVTSKTFEKEELEKAFKDWLVRFPNLEIKDIKIEYITRSDLYLQNSN